MKENELFKKYVEHFGDEPPYPPEHIIKTLVEMKENGRYDEIMDKAPEITGMLEEELGEELTIDHPLFDVDFRAENKIPDDKEFYYTIIEDRIMVLSLSEIKHCNECWEIVKDADSKKQTYQKLAERIKDIDNVLYDYCIRRWEDVTDDKGNIKEECEGSELEFSEWGLRNDRFDIEFLDENNLMARCLPNEIIDEFVDVGYSLLGEELYIISYKDEKKLCNRFVNLGYSIKKDHHRIMEALSWNYD